ncbi:Glutathione S-transferase [Macleaya cordata]|uniref:Glutathione S-transferase n=1 Tax=Macleaya cordata TaxID=56857 RepID=A0A200Q317_MACCD|nr:Glutathione S-transferase [Macleaya cordata]
MVVKVIGPSYASASRRVLVCLIEKKVEFEIIHIDFMKGEQKQPEYLKLQTSDMRNRKNRLQIV